MNATDEGITTGSGESNIYNLVPTALEGKQLVLKEQEDYQDQEIAREVYGRACGNLLHPGNWTTIAAVPGTSFTCLQDESLTEKSGVACEGDFVRISIPGPEPDAGKGFDCVRIEKINNYSDDEKSVEALAMRVRPCSDPFDKDSGKSDDTAHFFENDASSTFIISRAFSIVKAEYFGRNEVINNSEETSDDVARNSLVGTAAKMGFSRLQWDSFLKGLLK